MGVYEPNNLYCNLKLQAEQLIKDNLKDYLIIRIPRVYSKDRDKGLIRDIKNNTIPKEDYSKIVQFADINDFKCFFDKIINYRGTIDYSGVLQELSIKQIKEKYEL
jgi:nucleoside-diphosphate-sugar epimerase